MKEINICGLIDELITNIGDVDDNEDLILFASDNSMIGIFNRRCKKCSNSVETIDKRIKYCKSCRRDEKINNLLK